MNTAQNDRNEKVSGKQEMADDLPQADVKKRVLEFAEKTAAGSYEEKQRVEKPLSRDSRADWREWLLGIASAAGVDDPKIHADWVEHHFPMEDVLLSQKEREQMEKGWPMDGEPVELQQKAAAASTAALADGVSGWRRFAQTVLVATLRRMEERSDTPEEEIDVLVRALQPVRRHLRPIASELMLAARARLSVQHDQREGYYKTRGALAGTLSELKDEAARRRRGYLYWEILQELQAMGAAQVWSGTWASMVNADANNLAVVLDDLRLIAPSVACMKLAVVAGSAARKLGEDAQAEGSAHSGLLPFFDQAVPVTPEWAALLDDMGNVPSTWRSLGHDSSDLDMWLVELGAAVARAALGSLEDQPRKVASSLFNAGVTVSRGVKSDKAWEYHSECQIVLYGAGLLWVLSHRQGDQHADILDAMATHQGGSCAVNLMGTLVKFAPKDEARQALIGFVDALYGLQPVLSGGEFSRIGSAVKKLRFDPEPNATDPIPALTVLLERCLPGGSWQTAWKSFAEAPTPDSLGALLAQTGAKGHQHFAASLQNLATMLGEFEKQAEAWPDAFIATKMEDLLPDWRFGIEAEWRAMVVGALLPARLAATANDLIHG